MMQQAAAQALGSQLPVWQSHTSLQLASGHGGHGSSRPMALQQLHTDLGTKAVQYYPAWRLHAISQHGSCTSDHACSGSTGRRSTCTNNAGKDGYSFVAELDKSQNCWKHVWRISMEPNPIFYLKLACTFEVPQMPQLPQVPESGRKTATI